MDQFILFGDSITQKSFSQESGFGFGAALSNAYVRKLDVVNRGLGGYNTRQALHVLDSIVPRPDQAKVRFMTIFFGANDARLPNTPGAPQQHIPLDEFKSNLKAILTHPAIKAHPDIRLILITPPPIDERKCLANFQARYPELDPMLRRTAKCNAEYAQAARDVGQELQVTVLDLFEAMISRAYLEVTDSHPNLLPGELDAPQNKTLQDFVYDGLHFNPSAYKVLYTELMYLIKKEWPDQVPERLPFALPVWDDVKMWESVDSSL